MPLPPERDEIDASATPTLISWLMNVVLKLPSDARSSLRVDPLSLVGFTDARRTGYGNQDRIAVAYSVEQSVASSWLLAVVCDGVGGSSHGERAASMAIASMTVELAGLRRMGAVDTLREVMQRAHVRTSAAFHSKSSTTAVALLVMGEAAAIGWIGDSRAYQISGGKATLLTSDDTLAGAMAKADSKFRFELNEEYADRLSQAIGGESPVKSNAIAWKPPVEDAFCILCTDGVWKPTESAFDAVVGACPDGQELMRRLLLMSDWMGGVDNASAILIPPLEAVRKFIRNPANAIPRDSVMVCLPGNLQTLIPMKGIKGPGNSPRPRPQDRLPDESEEARSKPKKSSSKSKTGGLSKARSKGGQVSTSQLVIAEEPIDEASTHPTGTIQGDGTST